MNNVTPRDLMRKRRMLQIQALDAKERGDQEEYERLGKEVEGLMRQYQMSGGMSSEEAQAWAIEHFGGMSNRSSAKADVGVVKGFVVLQRE